MQCVAMLSRAKREIQARHNWCRNEFAGMCQELQLLVEVEDGPAESRRRPADVLVSGHAEGLPLSVVFAMVHPLRPTSSLEEVHPRKAKKTIANISRRFGTENIIAWV